MLTNDKFKILYLNRHGREADNAMLQLKATGFNTVEFVSRWSEAVVAMNSFSYDAVLVDINFKVSGLDSTKLLYYLCVDQNLSIVITASLTDTLDLDELDKLPSLELLLKPFSASLLEKCLHKAIGRGTNIKENTGLINKVEVSQKQVEVVFLKGAKKALERIDFKEISYIKADGAMTQIILNSNVKRFVDLSIKAVLSRFNRDDLFQIHKSYAVPLHSVQKVFREEVVLVDDCKLPVGRSYKNDFQRRLKEY